MTLHFLVQGTKDSYYLVDIFEIQILMNNNIDSFFLRQSRDLVCSTLRSWFYGVFDFYMFCPDQGNDRTDGIKMEVM